jgi:hypothetical protein
MSRARLLCGLGGLALGLLVDSTGTIGCATAPAPNDAVSTPPVAPRPPPAATPADAGPAAPGPAAAINKSAAPWAEPAAAVPEGPAPTNKLEGDSRPNLEMKEVSEKAWLANLRKKLGEKLNADPGDFRLSPRKQLVAFVRSPPVRTAPAAPAGKKKSRRPPPPPPPRKHQIIVADLEGKVQGTFRSLQVKGSDEPPKDLRFLSDTSLVYEVTKPPPPPVVAKPVHPRPVHHAARSKPVAAPPAPLVPVPPLSEQRLFVVQQLGKRPRQLRCEGWAFTWNPPKDHLAYVTGPVGKTFVAVDGVKMYPRKGQTIIASDPAWSKDGTSLAFLEARPAKPPRLVLLAEFDNPTGDTLWDLPPTVALEGTQVFWANHGKLVVGKSVLKPVFATPFVKEPPVKFDP